MKKLISCLLAVLLVCSLMSMNVFAAEDRTHPNKDAVVADQPYWVVGNQGANKDTNDSINDGDADPNGSASADINVNFGQPTDEDVDSDGTDPDNTIGKGETIVNRYAVDIVYGELILDLTNLDFTPDYIVEDDEMVENPDKDKEYFLVWDVNKYEYVLCTQNDDDTYTPVDKVETDADESADLLKTPFTVTGGVQIINHSDLAVATQVSLPNTNQITWSVQGATETGNTVIEEVAKATAKVGTTPGSPAEGTQYSFVATPNTGWADVIAQFMNGASNSTVDGTTVTVGGTITVTIAKSGTTTFN